MLSELITDRLGSSVIFKALIHINQATKIFEQCLIISSVSSILEIIAKNVFTALHTTVLDGHKLIVWPKANFPLLGFDSSHSNKLTT